MKINNVIVRSMLEAVESVPYPETYGNAALNCVATCAEYLHSPSPTKKEIVTILVNRLMSNIKKDSVDTDDVIAKLQFCIEKLQSRDVSISSEDYTTLVSASKTSNGDVVKFLELLK